MSNPRTIIAIDQGTTSSRAILFDETGTILAQGRQNFRSIFLMTDGSSMIRRISGRQQSR